MFFVCVPATWSGLMCGDSNKREPIGHVRCIQRPKKKRQRRGTEGTEGERGRRGRVVPWAAAPAKQKHSSATTPVLMMLSKKNNEPAECQPVNRPDQSTPPGRPISVEPCAVTDQSLRCHTSGYGQIGTDQHVLMVIPSRPFHDFCTGILKTDAHHRWRWPGSQMGGL